MPSFKDDLELIQYHAPGELTFEAKSYAELIAEIEDQVGKILVGSERIALGPLLELYADNKSGQVAVLFSQPSDFARACATLRRKCPLPEKSRVRFVQTQYHPIVSKLKTALDNEMTLRATCKRPLTIPKKLQATYESDEDGQAIRGTHVSISQKLIDGLVNGDKDAVAIIGDLLVKSKAGYVPC